MYKIIWSPIADKEFSANLVFWTEHNYSNSYSLKIISEVMRLQEILRENPYIGKPTEKDRSVFKVLILRNFYLYYSVENQVINVLSFKAFRKAAKLIRLVCKKTAPEVSALFS